MSTYDDLIEAVDAVDAMIEECISRRSLVIVCVDNLYYAINPENGNVLIDGLRYEDMVVNLMGRDATVTDVYYVDSLTAARRWAMSRVAAPRYSVRRVSRWS